ncbi:hypothetical protein ACFVWZ_03865 [Streptomyces sp. NPDC058200]|uniref:hypothetical protein n=1 Tax=Streptomyces sp. NPDC058200 TaxID=3346378 RepID=UPI0036EADDFA
MPEAGLTDVYRRTGRASLTRRDRQATAAPHLIGRDTEALALAVTSRRPRPGLGHHSDKGSPIHQAPLP